MRNKIMKILRFIFLSVVIFGIVTANLFVHGEDNIFDVEEYIYVNHFRNHRIHRQSPLWQRGWHARTQKIAIR